MFYLRSEPAAGYKNKGWFICYFGQGLWIKVTALMMFKWTSTREGRTAEDIFQCAFDI